MSVSGEVAEQLSLFGSGGIDLARLRLVRQGLGRGSRSRGTEKAYACDWRQFRRWCGDAGRPSLPASSDTVMLYVTWLLTERGRRAATAARHVAAVADAHRSAGLANPVSGEVRDVVTAVRRVRSEVPRGKVAMEPSLLRECALGCDVRTALGLRDRALLVLGFATSLRRSELCRLNLADISFEQEGVAVMVRRSKTDQLGRGRVLGVWPGKRAATDPVRVLKAWIRARGDWDGPLFARVQTGDVITRRGITGDAVADAVKRAVQRAGRRPAAYGAHSLRAGAVTASAEIGRSDQEIMGLSGHASAAVMRMYVRRVRLFAGRNPLAGVL